MVCSFGQRFPQSRTIMYSANDEEKTENIGDNINTIDINDIDDDKQDISFDPVPTLPFFPTIFAYIAFISFWPLLAFIRINFFSDNPINYFDIDKYMTLRNMMDSTTTTIDTNGITELPALSPAEQLVGTIFGPPPPPPR